MTSLFNSILSILAFVALLLPNVLSLPIMVPIDDQHKFGITGRKESPETLIHAHPQLLGLPAADGNLHIFALPVGNGDASVIMCPKGDLMILDMGQDSDEGWQPQQVKSFFSGDLERLTTIIISHPTPSHYMILPSLIANMSQVPNLQRIILGGQYYDYDRYEMIRWMNMFQHIVEFVNGGYPCVSDCPNDPPQCLGDDHSVSFKILGANLGEVRKGRSITMHIKTEKPEFQLFWQGDLRGMDIEDQIVMEWQALGYSLNSTHMKIGNRAAKFNESNSEKLLKAVTPRYAFSSNPYPGRWNLKPDCRTYFRLVSLLSVRKRNTPGYFACQNYDTFEVDQYENWCYEIYTTAPSPNAYSTVQIIVDLSQV